jgi:hypothetical protein
MRSRTKTERESERRAEIKEDHYLVRWSSEFTEACAIIAPKNDGERERGNSHE